MKLHAYVFMIGSLIALSACDELCSSTVNDQALVQNRTNRALSVEICKGKIYGRQTVSIPVDQDGVVALGARKSGYVKAGTESLGSCDRPDGAPSKMGIALTSRDFASVKFCYRNANDSSDVIVVDRGDACPSGAREQTTPVDSCE
ncbi:MAG: hypothetical protein JST04_06565 [Bdellovibrionales bacterium]|nr:hypothetical protein [Bdellovibrionales bacterium]